MTIDPYLIVRAASLYVAAVATMAVWWWRRPDRRAVAGAALAFAWNLPVVLAINVVADRAGWWQFDASGGQLLGVPVDLYLAWAWLWGFAAALAFPELSIVAVVVIALVCDLILMPAASPVVQLGRSWLAGEALALVTALVPGQLLARWTRRNESLERRAALQVLTAGGVVGFVLPAVIIQESGGRWSNPLDQPERLMLFAQVLAIPILAGVSAVQEFVTRGGGTPVPFDPPRRLVTSGLYAYVRNPMQLSGVLFLVLLGLLVDNLWISAAGIMAHVYSAGIAGWDEDGDLERRFGSQWLEYRGAVRRWMPRFRPWHPSNRAGQLFVAESCGMCRGVARWVERRDPRHLVIEAAEAHPSAALTRITYDPRDGSPPARGVEAVARALEHIHIGWALAGCVLRLPGIRQTAQLLVDASGGEPRPANQSCSWPT